MKVWHKGKHEELGRVLLGWRHRAVGRFIMKIGSWLLGAIVMGLLAAISLHAIGQDAIAQQGGRITFFLVFIIGVVSAFFRHVYYGLYYQIREKALVAVRPFCGFERFLTADGQIDQSIGTKLDYLPWDQIKDAKEVGGKLHLVIKDYKEPLKIGVSPVRALLLPLSDGRLERRSNQGGLLARDNSLDKETMRLILQKIREVKKAMSGK